MKTIYLFTLLCCLFAIPDLQAQIKVADSSSEIIPENLIHPVYPGGPGALQNYVVNYLKGLHYKKSQRIYVNFVVEKDGTLSNIEFSKGAERKFKKKVIQALRNCERWTPGMLDGKLVRVSFTLPIIINI